MKRSNILFAALIAAVMVGCGGGSNTTDPNNRLSQGAPVQPPEIKRMLQGGTPRVIQGAAASTPAVTDVVSIAGYRANHTISKNQQTGVVTVTNTVTNEVKTFQNPNLIKFVDYYVSFDIDGAAGQVFRLYQAAFNRKPDLGGLGFWIYHAEKGMVLNDIAGGFLNSDEFKAAYGANPSDLTYVNQLYQNVLHRAGEDAGVKWWGQVLASGVARTAVITGFSQSDENKNNVNPGLINGFDYVPYVPVTETKTFSTCVNDLGLTSLEGTFRLVNNIWNPGTSKYTQCASATIAKETGVQNAVFDWNFTSNDNSVKTYPSVAYGQKSGYTESTTTKLPALVGELGNVFVTGNVTTTCATVCLYDTALDMFFSKTKTTNGFNPSSEIMVLTDYNVKMFGGTYQGRVTVDGAEYDLYQGTIPNGSDPTQTWNYISYVAVKNSTVLALNMKSFITDSVKRGFVKNDEYLGSIEMGTEVIYGKGQTTMANFQITQ